jgi:hypothetical protein
MTVETLLFNALKGLVSNRVYPDEAPEGVVAPYIIYQQVGGNSTNYRDGSAPALKNCRMQITVWSKTRAEASSLMESAESALRVTTSLNAEALTEKMSDNDPITKLRGARQDFSFWT